MLSYQSDPQTVHENGWHNTVPKVKPKRLHVPLVAGCSIDEKPCHHHVSGWVVDQTKKLKYASNKFFSEMVYVSLRTYYHTDVWCSMCLGFYHLFNAIKTATCWCAESSSKLILQRKMATFIARKRMASFLDSGRNVTVKPNHSADADGYLFNIRSLFKRRCCLIKSREGTQCPPLHTACTP